MKIKSIVWFNDIIEKLIRKHNVQQYEVREVLANKPHFRLVEKGHRTSENVYAALGKTDSDRYLVVFFVYKTDQRVLILSARDMTKAERRRYDKT